LSGWRRGHDRQSQCQPDDDERAVNLHNQ
jgi:hypothetical protein